MSRREFLKKTGDGAIAITVGGVAAQGCKKHPSPPPEEAATEPSQENPPVVPPDPLPPGADLRHVRHRREAIEHELEGGSRVAITDAVRLPDHEYLHCERECAEELFAHQYSRRFSYRL